MPIEPKPGLLKQVHDKGALLAGKFYDLGSACLKVVGRLVQ